MAKIELPKAEELDYSRVQGNERLVRHGVKQLLGGLAWAGDKEITIREALADRPAMAERLKRVLGPQARQVVFDAEYDLDVAVREVVDIVLDAVGSQLND